MAPDTYDPTEDFVDERTDDPDLGDFGGGVDESPDVNDDGEIVSSSSDEEIRDFSMEDDRDVSSDDEDDGGTTETRKTTLDQEGLDGENIFAGGGDGDADESICYDPTEEFDPDPEYKKGGIGGGRQGTLEAIERRDKLDEVTADDIDSLDDLTRAVREIHLDGYMSPPEEVIETIENVYNDLRDDAKSEYLTDETLLRRINSARRYFDETYLPRLRRVKEMPSPVEAGRANYPANKAQKRSESHRDAAEELKKKLGTATGVSGGIKSAARGAKQRALNAVGSSVAEENEKVREKKREKGRNAVEKGDLIQGGQPTPSVFEVIRVNKKSVTGRKPNPRAGQEKALGDGVEDEWIEGRTDFDGMTFHHITEDDLDNLGEVLPRADNISQDSYDSFDELRRDVGLPIERESEYVGDEERECVHKLAERADISENRAATLLEEHPTMDTYEDVLNNAVKYGNLTVVDGIGDSTAESIKEHVREHPEGVTEKPFADEDDDKTEEETDEDDAQDTVQVGLAGDEPYDSTEEFVDSRDEDEVGTFNDFDGEGSNIDEDVPEGYEGDRVIRGTERWLNPERNTVFLVREKAGDVDFYNEISAKEITEDDLEVGEFDGLEDDRARTWGASSPWNDGEDKYSRDALTIEFNDLEELAEAWEPVYAPSIGVTGEQTELLRQSDNVVVGDGETADQGGDADAHSYENADKNTPPTWTTIQKSPSRIRWRCETGEHVSVTENDDGTYSVKRESADRTPFDTIAGRTYPDEDVDHDAEGIPNIEDAIGIAYSYMEGNACLSEEEIYGDEALEDASVGPGNLAQESEYDRRYNKETDEVTRLTDEERRAMERDASTSDDGETAPYDPTVEFEDLFGGAVPDDETQRDVMREVEEEKSDVPYHPDDREDIASEDEQEMVREDLAEEKDSSEDGTGEPTEMEFGAKDVADTYRDEYAEHLHDDDDRRRNTVLFEDGTPDAVLEDARAAATETRADKTKDSYGQAELTEREKSQIDFTKTSVFHARTAKAIAAGEGVSNWLDYYDPTLTTDEHIEVYKNAEAASRLDSDELDEETIDQKAAEMSRAADAAECDHAEDGCRDGYEEACEFLVEECDVPEDRAEELLDEDDFGGGGSLPDDSDLEAEETPLEARIALNKAWTGYRAGRAKAKEDELSGACEARSYAAVINAVRDALGQERLEFEPAGKFEGGVVSPDDVGVEFEASGFSAYDPVKDIAR